MRGSRTVTCGLYPLVLRVVNKQAAKWRHEEGDYRDDITAICVKLHEIFQA